MNEQRKFVACQQQSTKALIIIRRRIENFLINSTIFTFFFGGRTWSRELTIQPNTLKIHSFTDTKQSWELILIFTNKDYLQKLLALVDVRRNYACHLHAVDVNVNFLERDCSNMSIEGVSRDLALPSESFFLSLRGGREGGRGGREFSSFAERERVCEMLKNERFVIVLLCIDREWNTIFKIDV